jgi:ketosteroid isomerase-like protein
MTIEDQTMEAERRWNATYLAGDVDGFAELVSESFLYLSERGVFGREEYIANLSSGVIEMRDLKTLASTTRSFGDVVIVTGEARLDASFRGQDISGTDRYTRVWQREADGAMRAISLHANAVAEAG